MTEDELIDMIANDAEQWVFAGGTNEAAAAEALRRFPCVADDWKRTYFSSVACNMLAEVPEGIHYYDPVSNWRNIKPHLGDRELNDILVRDFNKYTFGRWRKRFTRGQFPEQFESCDWRPYRPGRYPAYWRYVKHAACHWLVNFNLKLATLVEPRRKWRILTSDHHSTVWDGHETLFDFNFSALGISPKECFLRARCAYELAPRQQLRIGFTGHYSNDPAKDTLAGLYAEMTAGEIEAVKAEARAWRKARGKLRVAAASSPSKGRAQRAKQRQCDSRREPRSARDSQLPSGGAQEHAQFASHQ